MKKILVINGSARKASVSTALCESFLGDKAGFETKTYNAYSLNAKPCCGCGMCGKTVGCCYDDLDDLMADFEQADYLVISTPVYNGGVSAPLKAVTDRFQRYYAMRFDHGMKPAVAKHKKAALIIAAGSKGEGREEIKAMYERMFTVLNTSLESVIFFDSTDKREPDEAAVESVKQEGEYFFNG